jgi:hypothetical protein
MSIEIQRQLLTDSWTARADALEAALVREPSPACEGCQVILSEVPQDGLLHVTVVNAHKTMMVSGWVGPLARTDGLPRRRRGRRGHQRRADSAAEVLV